MRLSFPKLTTTQVQDLQLLLPILAPLFWYKCDPI